ncbi:MAG: tetratricopeptide repeat protein [Myxococcota bacterium]
MRERVVRALPVLVLLAAALAVRLAYVWEFRGSPLFDHLVPGMDEANYDAWAQRIAAGDVLGEGTFTANPLAPYVLGGLYALFGRDLLVVRVMQALAGTATCFFLYRSALHVFGRRPAIATLALAGFYGPAIFVGANLVAEGWCLLFGSASMALLTSPGGGAWGRAAAGALLALAAMGRPNLLLLVGALPLAAEVAIAEDTVRARARRVVAWMLGAALVLGPVLARNAERGGEAVLVTAHGGVNLWIGNNPDADGFFRTPPGSELAGGQESLVTSSVAIAEEDLGRSLTPGEASRWWRDRAVAFALDQPAEWLALTLRKVGHFVNAYEPPLESNYAWALDQFATLRWGTVGYGLVCPLALAGMVLAAGRLRELAVPFAFAGIYAASVVAYFVSMRYRLPVVIALLPFAGFAVGAMVELAAARAWRRLAVAGVVGLGGAALAHTPIPADRVEMGLAFQYFNLGNVALETGRPAEAQRYFEDAVRLYPERARFYNNLGLAYLRADRAASAVDAFERGIALGYRDRRIYRNLGAARLALGQNEEALEAYEHAAAVSPRHAGTWFNVGTVRERLGREAEAREAYLRARTLTGDGRLLERIDERLDGLRAPGRSADVHVP